MKKSIFLALAFFLGLALLWWLEYARVPRTEERLARMQRVLPELYDARVPEVDRLEIKRGDRVARFERRDRRRWRIVEPIEAAADPAVVENLVKNLIDLSRSPDVGTLEASEPSYGLTPPVATIRIDGSRGKGEDGRLEFRATLDVGNVQRGVRFVRAEGGAGIETVEAGLLAAIDRSIEDWREKAILPVPIFQVVGLSIQSADAANAIELERSRKVNWAIRRPIHVPADAPRIESLLTSLTALRVADGPKGFVANDARDLSPYGLDKPEASLKIRLNDVSEPPIVLQFGKSPPDRPDRIYLKHGDRDEILLVDSKVLADIPREIGDLRVSRVADFEAARIAKIEVDAPALGPKFVLERNAREWVQKMPTEDAADAQAVRALIGAIDSLESSQRFAPEGAADQRMSPLAMTVRMWEARRSRDESGGATIEESPAVAIQFGRVDALRKTIYGRIEGDTTILALPDLVTKALPQTRFPFKDRALPRIDVGRIRKFSVTRGSRTVELAPASETGTANRWTLVAPAEGNADMPTLSRIFAALSSLRATDFVIESKDVKPEQDFGMENPTTRIRWELESREPRDAPGRNAGGSLTIGKKIGRTSDSEYFARLNGFPLIFTLDAATVANFEEELRDHAVLTMPADRVEKVVLRWPHRSVALSRKPGANGSATPTWEADSPGDSAGIDPAQINALVGQLSKLQTNRFVQYRGFIPATTGLNTPRLKIEIRLKGDPVLRVIRVGKTREEKDVYAAVGTGDSGPVFLLPAAAWNQFIASGQPKSELPEDVFTPTSGPRPVPDASP